MLFREIIPEDYYNGYTELMFEFSKYDKKISFEEFAEYISRRDMVRIIVAIKDNRVVGAGSIFKLDKLHYNPVGQIEDVIITERYRGTGIGKQIIDRLVDLGLTKFHCYNVILNCLEKNRGFYNKCGFEMIGLEMRYVINK
jgi:glucosamine-phosphate N-acetyltransferase